MNAYDLRKKFLNFFAHLGHKIIPSTSLIPKEEVELAGTRQVLFTTAGMHPLTPYLLGKRHPLGKRLVSVQKSLRTDDIDEVGDSWHNTFFEMLGNWSLGDYWKEEAISWSFEFLTEELEIKKEKLWITVFAGDKDAPRDTESENTWQKLGIPKNRIIPLAKKDNWWGPVGDTGPCGPDTEMFMETTDKPCGPNCQPGDNCGRFAEIWNDVFMEYEKLKDESFVPLKQKNVDTGMGVERTLAVLQKKDNVFETDVFWPLIEGLQEKIFKKYKYGKEAKIDRSFRIMSDHIRAAVFIIGDGVEPSNKDRGYILRRLIRRTILQKILWGEKGISISILVPAVIKIFKNQYPELVVNQNKIQKVIEEEEKKTEKAILAGIKEFRKISGGDAVSTKLLSGQQVFDLYQSHGLPIELTKELSKELGRSINEKGALKLLEEHKKLSRTGAQEKFAGGLANQNKKTIKGHTVTHLLHQALRDVLGDHVYQTGSNITAERVRFDFSHDEKLTEEQIKKVEEIVNQKIREDLKVQSEIMFLHKARQIGAIGLFGEKYPDQVSVYFIGDYSKEFCGGPHARSTGELGKFKILKEESAGSGLRRIYAQVV
ncbi:alanine--tRNA ligase [Candidatus Curtissbacteria bacterium RBG_16_39_7]|uniref:Alanine--tRNA ligase n=1 Tax=Candidatus Curtissbacteria bacterium RBG_16_39_7 TaxID=1797707 RepID=A0A1F5G394_9BACT|nr:MAG: alanine--tRNA ligase [Candidatus Curtissbacteria bacterium RBG_16_39_7]